MSAHHSLRSHSPLKTVFEIAPAHHHRSQSWHRHNTAQPHTTVLQIGTEAADLDHNHTTEDTTAKVTINPSEHVLGYTRETTGDISGVVHADSIQTLIHTALNMTPCTKAPPLIEVHQAIHDITADHTLSLPIGQLRKPHIRIHPIPEDPMEIHTIRGIQESPQMIDKWTSTV